MNYKILLVLTIPFLLLCSNQLKAQDEKPDNIVIFIADGMGMNHLSAAALKSDEDLNITRLENISFLKCSSLSSLSPDNAAAITAITTGVKTNNGTVGMDQNNVSMKNLMEIAKENKMKTGLITTSSITYASIAPFYAHRPSKKNDEQMASDLLDANLDVIIGGGMKYFEKRNDDQDLLFDFKKKGYKIYDKQKDLKSNNKNKFIALVSENHLANKTLRGDYLSMALNRAVKNLLVGNDGFFLVVSNPQIDWASQANNESYLQNEMLDFDAVVGELIDFLGHDKKTLIIVLSPYESGGLSVNSGELDGSNLNVEWTSKSINANLAPVFAHGPGAELFTGIYDNTEVYSKIKSLMQK